MKRKRYTQIEVARILAKYRRSGLSALQFSRKNGISSTTLYNWLKKESGRQQVVEVDTVLPGPPTSRTCSFFWPDGRKLEFPAEVSEERLSGMVRALRGAK